MKLFTLLFFMLTSISCRESFDIDDVIFEENLVVKAILTDEFKHHSVQLWQTVPIDSINANPLQKANVFITDDDGTTYNFEEKEDGVYMSTLKFSAESEKLYSLNIETNNGVKYSSTQEQLPPISELGDLDFEIASNILDESELIIKANSVLKNNDAKYYRYEYDETYKIRAPYWNARKIIVVSEDPYIFDTTLKDPTVYGVGFCYGNKKSNKIIVTETTSLSQNQVQNFPIRFIPLESYVIGQRYSLLLKQYVLNKSTYDYYNLLSKFSDPDNIFSQIQLGNIASNIKPEKNSIKNKVYGVFEVSSVNIKRFYLNREDITDTGYINYITAPSCEDRPEPFLVDDSGSSPLFKLLNNDFIYFDVLPFPQPPNQKYKLIPKPCGDCSYVGSPIKPDFWED